MIKSRVTYSNVYDIKNIVEDVVRALNDFFWYADCLRILVLRFRNSRDNAIARIHALLKIWRYILETPP